MSAATSSDVFNAEAADLHPADRKMPLGPYLRAVWARRDFIRYLAESQLRGQQMNTVLGNLWHLLNPLLQIGVYYLIFGVVLGVDRGVDNFIAFIAIGLFAYQHSVRAIMAGARSVVGNESMMRSIWFPRAMLPLTSTLTELLAFIPAFAVAITVCLVTGEAPLVSWLAVAVLVPVQTLFNFGAAMLAARAASHFNDIQQVLPFVFRLLLYASGVLFLVDEYVENSSLRLLFELNPFYGFVSLYRWAILGYDVNTHVAFLTPAVSLVVLAAGFAWFRRGEQGFGRG